ncbi:ArsA family ATPase [Bdellovibrio reynosensis]|uniref:arsenite-transporting ATPase n=1 Tax=Bdellovibrio reynosensis TaxID=2835041 RepID=A0ABY4C6P7_9BACT|nr:ArsA family ATPase [Bdellovibrio reynosensis]UOF00558.1 ArsA family ATPase [Bdellovibrio reynosensis]
MKQEIHFVTGKGGVGKSVIAAAMALKKSREGKKVLLVELGDISFFKDFFDLPSVGYQPTRIKDNLSVALWDGEAALKEYARHFIKVEAIVKLFFENAVMKALVNVAPGLSELAIVGKVTSGPRKHGPPLPFDCIVVDGFATGHFIALLEAPRGMAQAVQFGPMGEQSRSIDACLRNTDLCHYHVVTLPEELPVKEASELIHRLKAEFSVSAEILMNKIIQTKLTSADLKDAKAENSDLGKFAEYLDYQLTRQSEMLERTKQATEKVQHLPLLYETYAWTLTEKIAEALK